ncbi:MAG TPA: hypothetical protein VKB03_02325 [Conexibacter sp.]|nr:hypothetical protein [Conexibacter sp.]
MGRLRACAITVSVAILGCSAFAFPARAAELRHYEQVSPVDKGDGDIIGEGLSTLASDAGEAVAFDSRLVFGDAIGSGSFGLTTYLARRGASGWSTHSVTPRPLPETVQVLAGGTQVWGFADDLSTALVWGYDLPAASDDTPLRENLYVEDTATGALRTISVTQQDPLSLFDFLNGEFGGYSADAKHVAFVTSTRMLPEATSDGSPNLYKWDDGVLSVAGILPDGSLPPGGSTVFPSSIRGTMSPDGSRLVFMASPDGIAPPQLYLRVDGGGTVWVSEPERGDRDRTPPDGDRTPANGIVFEGMTPDGNNVFFVSDDPLVDEDDAPGPDMYRFTYSPDAASNGRNLTLITNDGQSAYFLDSFGGTLVGMSDDARRAYLHDSGGTLKLWQEDAQGLTTVDPSAPRTDPSGWLTLAASMPGNGRVSPDANWLAYIKDGQMYLYDRSRQSLTCVSCPSDASIVPAVTNAGQRDIRGFRPRFLSDDGQVFFNSTGSLVPADTNGVADVYEYDGLTGTLSLLSTGKGREPVMFADASRSGDDVFVVTRQQLVRSDRDDYVDVYDVRVGPAPPVPPIDTAPACEGEACQGALPATPVAPNLGSSSFEGDATPGVSHVRLAVKRRVTLRGATGVLSVKHSAAGRIAWRGRGLVSGSLRRGGAGTAKVRLRLGKSARERFERSGRYATAVRLSFRTADGGRATRVIQVTFKTQSRKGR